MTYDYLILKSLLFYLGTVQIFVMRSCRHILPPTPEQLPFCRWVLARYGLVVLTKKKKKRCSSVRNKSYLLNVRTLFVQPSNVCNSLGCNSNMALYPICLFLLEQETVLYHLAGQLFSCLGIWCLCALAHCEIPRFFHSLFFKLSASLWTQHFGSVHTGYIINLA